MCDTLLQKMDDSVDLIKDYLCSERNLAANTIEAYNSDIVQFVVFAIRRGWNKPCFGTNPYSYAGTAKHTADIVGIAHLCCPEKSS